MPILIPGQERKSGRRWVWVAALVLLLGILAVLPASVLLIAKAHPIYIKAAGREFFITHPNPGYRVIPTGFSPYDGQSSNNDGPFKSCWFLRLGNDVWLLGLFPPQRP